MADLKSDPRPSMVEQFSYPSQHQRSGMPDDMKDEETVTMVFPHDVSVNLDDYKGLLHFKTGVREVPVSVSTHPYLRKNGVAAYAKTKIEETKPSGPNLETMTKAELIEYAAEAFKLTLAPTLTKAELIAAVEEAKG